MTNRVLGSLVLIQLFFFSEVLCLQDSGVPCYLHPSDDSCHYFTKTDPTECMSDASKAALSNRILHLNKSLTGLEQLLVRLGVIPPDDACPELPPVSDGGVVYSDISLAPGCSAKYVCNEGYTFFGHRTFNCTDGGIWEGNITQTPTCEATVTQCDVPIDINNGSVVFEDNDPASILLGDTISYACAGGYKLAGSAERFCLKTGNWSGSEALCIEVQPSGLKTKDDEKQSIAIGVSVGGVATLAIAAVLILVGGRAAYKKLKGKKVPSSLTVEDESPVTSSSSGGGYSRIVSPEHTAAAHVTVGREPKKKGRAGRTSSSEVEASL